MKSGPVRQKMTIKIAFSGKVPIKWTIGPSEIEKENIVNPLQKKIDRIIGLGAQIPHLGITV